MKMNGQCESGSPQFRSGPQNYLKNNMDTVSSHILAIKIVDLRRNIPEVGTHSTNDGLALIGTRVLCVCLALYNAKTDIVFPHRSVRRVAISWGSGSCHARLGKEDFQPFSMIMAESIEKRVITT